MVTDADLQPPLLPALVGDVRGTKRLIARQAG
jgi:hypothetical protein